MSLGGMTGKTGELIAARFLCSKDYKIIAQNFWTRVGEIDIIAEDGETLVFVEVKTRTEKVLGNPYEAITSEKIRRCRRACELYVQQVPQGDRPFRIDAISIILNTQTRHAKVQHFQNITA